MKISNFTPILFSLFLAFVIVSIIGYQTSPFYREPCCGDSAVFYTVGRWWAEGYLPYVDLWDQKGPFIHFVNLLGYSITASRAGVWILQILFLMCSVYFVFKFYLLEFAEKISYVLTILTFVGYVELYIGGNCVDEYLLPFLSIAFYLIYKWTDTAVRIGSFNHNSWYSCLYGFIFGLALMSRLTSAIGVCAAITVLGICLMTQGKWKNISLNLCAFLGGIGFVILPFVIYFYFKGALADMWYGTFIFNAEYAKYSSANIFTLKGFLNLFLRFINSYSLIFISIAVLVFNRSRRFVGLFWLIVSLGTFAWFINSFAFAGYAIITIPYACISIIELHRLSKLGSVTRKIYGGYLIFYTVMVVAGATYTVRLFSREYLDNRDLQAYRNMLNDLPVSYKSSFIGYNCNQDLYQYEDIRPAYPYFYLQDFLSKTSSSFKEKLRNSFCCGNVKYILVKGKKTHIDDILRQKYNICRENNESHLILYELKK